MATVRQSRGELTLKRYLMKASTAIVAGDSVMLDSNGLAVPAAASASNKGCVGCAQESKTSASSGSYYIEVAEGEFLYDATSIAQSSLLGPVYFSNSTTMDETQGSNEPKGGKLVEVVSSTAGWVRQGVGFLA